MEYTYPILKHNQRDATLYNILYCCQCSTCFEWVFRSSSGAQKLYMQHRVLVKLVSCDRMSEVNFRPAQDTATDTE
jgi:hypothetical protein